MNSGLVLDVYDDCEGSVLRSIYPTREEIPSLVKNASILSADDRERLPDDCFALVMISDGEKMRKFACVDAGHTSLSVEYFMKNAHKLPKPAQKTAAENLLVACEWYGIEPSEELQKAAGLDKIVGRAMLLNDANNTAKDVGAGMRTFNSMPAHEVQPFEQVSAMRAAQRQKRASVMKPHVEVTNEKTASAPVAKTATITALRGQFPLDNYAQVKRASAYFDVYWKKFTPEDRHEYCVNLTKRASALGIEVADLTQKYGSESYAPAEEIKVALDCRRQLLRDPHHKQILNSLQSKTASIEPELFCQTLQEFDKLAGLHHHYDSFVTDPFLSTFGFEKVAQFSEVIGNDRVTAHELECLARHGIESVKATFDADLAEGFKKEPIDVFKSLPVEQKKILMRLANECASRRG